MSPSSHASSAAASHRTRIICATCSRARSAARLATNSRSRSAASIIARSIAPATSELVAGGRHRSDQGRPQAWKRHPRERGADCARPGTPQAAAARSSFETWRGSADIRRRPDDSRHAHPDAACGELFHTATGTAYVDLLINGHRETWPIRSKRFRGWLRRRYYEATGAPWARRRSARSSICSRRGRNLTLPSAPVHVRVAEHAGHIYLDLADEHWRAVEIGPDGWRVIGCPPVRFRRPAGMLPLPVPERRGVDRSPRCRFSTYPAETISCWSWLGCWRHCDPAAPIPYSRYPASKGRPRPSCRKCSRPWSIPMLPRCGRSRARNAS